MIHAGIEAHHGGSGAKSESHLHHTEHSKLLPWLMLIAILSGVAVAFSILGFISLRDMGALRYQTLHDQMLRDQRSFEQMRVQVLSQNAILQREGFIRPGDEWMGPEGNLQFSPKLLTRGDH